MKKTGRRSSDFALARGLWPGFALCAGAAMLIAPQAVAQSQATASSASEVVARLEEEIRRSMLDGGIPSVAAAITDRAGTLWAGAFGFSNLWARTPASTNTYYLIGSTFKAQSTIALLQQLESHGVRLDEAVGGYAGLEIRGEDPERPVTFRHLLTHASGMPVDFGPHPVWGPTAPLSLDQYLADSLRVTAPPLSGVVYSNMAYSLAAHLVQRFAGAPYKEYIRARVWGALGMNGARFDVTPFVEERLATPYATDEETGRLVPVSRLKANVWPAGIVYGTIHDQAKWTRFNLGDGAWEGERVLPAGAMEEMHRLQYPQFAGEPMGGGWGYEDTGYGLTWWVSRSGSDRYFAHSGSVPGYTAFVAGNRTRGFGAAFLTNGNRAHPHLARLADRALALMEELLGESR